MIREIRLTIKRDNQHRKITVYQSQLSLYYPLGKIQKKTE